MQQHLTAAITLAAIAGIFIGGSLAAAESDDQLSGDCATYHVITIDGEGPLQQVLLDRIESRSEVGDETVTIHRIAADGRALPVSTVKLTNAWVGSLSIPIGLTNVKQQTLLGFERLEVAQAGERITRRAFPERACNDTSPLVISEVVE